MKIETQKIYLNEEDSVKDAALEVIDEILDGDIYGWDNMLSWKEYVEDNDNG